MKYATFSFWLCFFATFVNVVAVLFLLGVPGEQNEQQLVINGGFTMLCTIYWYWRLSRRNQG